jgi:hypothetical protein
MTISMLLLLDLKLFVEAGYAIKVFVRFPELVYSSSKVRGWYLGVPTHQCLKNSIVNEGILILQSKCYMYRI